MKSSHSASPQGLTPQQRYERTPKGRATRRRYRRSAKGLATWAQQKKRHRPQHTDFMRRWRETPAGERQKHGLPASAPAGLVRTVALHKALKQEIRNREYP